MSYKIKSNEVSRVEPRQFRQGGKFHHKVRIYLEATDGASLSSINLVQYELHPTFREPIRVANDIRTHFEIQIWTYGYFGINATLVMKDGSTQTTQGFVKW
jgi:transcription initiation factor IIF auxiliary subunit